MTDILQRELVALAAAHLLALIPIGALLLAGRMSPLYEVPSRSIARWWAWCALLIVASAVLGSAVAKLG